MSSFVVPLPRGRSLDLSAPRVMAIVNLTEDSFYAGSRVRIETGLDYALKAIDDGADILDIGAESTRPGANPAPVDEELERVTKLVTAIRSHSDIPISIDTRKAVVAKSAICAGADIINDISALQADPDMASVCANYSIPVVLMHMKGTPETMQLNPFYENAAQEVFDYLFERAAFAISKGIHADRIILDPGIGFGKRLQDNLQLIIELAQLSSGRYPVLIGLSRKSFLGLLSEKKVEDRLAASLAASYKAVQNGAHILRVHDVSETVDMLKVFTALETGKYVGKKDI